MGKVWEWRNQQGGRGNHLMKSNGCESRPAKASKRAGSECCHSPGDWWVRSVHSKEVGREDSAPKSVMVAMPTPLVERKAASGTTANAKGGPGSPESLAQGMLPKGFSMSPGELAISARKSGKTAAKGDRRRLRMDGGAASYDLIVPVKVGDRRVSERSGHGTHWREGGNKVTYLLKET